MLELSPLVPFCIVIFANQYHANFPSFQTSECLEVQIWSKDIKGEAGLEKKPVANSVWEARIALSIMWKRAEGQQELDSKYGTHSEKSMRYFP